MKKLIILALSALVLASVAGAANLVGTSGADTLTGTNSQDSISGLGGNDTISANCAYGEGWDSSYGNDGADTIYAGPCTSSDSHDSIVGADGNDKLAASNGQSDHLYGNLGVDECWYDQRDTVQDCEILHFTPQA